MDVLDPRLRTREQQRFIVDKNVPVIPPGAHVVLVGHRAAGKSTLLRALEGCVQRPRIDLDDEIQRREGRSIHALFAEGEAVFRAAEARAFKHLAGSSIVAVGGGFVQHHAALLQGHVVVLVPVTRETFMERMRADTRRPRLHPGLSLDEELVRIFSEREPMFAALGALTVGGMLRALGAGA